MQTIALLSQKGGAGKSTLARQLSVLAGEEGASVIVDLDPQATASRWWRRRQDLDPPPGQPELVDLGSTPLAKAVEALRQREGVLWIDSRPAVSAREAEIARAADIIIVPVRPSPDDLEAVTDTLDMLARLDKHALIVVNAAKNERRAIDARAALSQFPVKVCPHHLADRAIYLDTAMSGQGVSEARGGAAEAATAELRRVWQWIKEAARG